MKEERSLYQPKKYNLRNTEDKASYVEHLKNVNKQFPGFIAPDGEEVNVQEFIDKWMKENPEDAVKSDQPSIEEIKEWDHSFKDENVPFWMRKYQDHFEPTEQLEGENTVGIEMPKYLKKNNGTGVAH